MSGKTVNSAILLLIIGNAMAIASDVFIKLLEPDAPIFQFAFLRCVITLAFLLPLARKLSRQHLFAGAKVHAIRAHIHLAGIICMVVALTNLHLATANAIFYAAALALWEGADWSPGIVFSAAGSALFILGYNITVLLAYKQVDANQVTSAEYTGLIWAVGIGWIWFGEVPDLWFLAGSTMIVVPLVLIGLSHRRKSPARGFNPAGREKDRETLEPRSAT